MKLTFAASLIVVAINAVTGTLIAWVLVRDSFRGKSVVNAIIDLPFALPTIVAGLTLLAVLRAAEPVRRQRRLHPGSRSCSRSSSSRSRSSCARSSPCLLELDREMEEAAASLGASPFTTFRRIDPAEPDARDPVGLRARASGGRSASSGPSILISGNIPFETEVTSWYIFELIESDAPQAAAAVSVVLLACSFAVLVGADLLERWTRRHDG